MKPPARKVRLVGEAEYRDQAEAALGDAGDASLVLRGRPRSVVMACPDGCGETLVVNLDGRAGKAWRFDMRGGGLTLFPSVWRDGGCGSHFIVWRGQILWCDQFERDNLEPDYDEEIEDLVLGAMDVAEPRNVVQLADAIDELVWDVDRAANRLVRRGAAKSCKIDGQLVFTRSA